MGTRQSTDIEQGKDDYYRILRAMLRDRSAKQQQLQGLTEEIQILETNILFHLAPIGTRWRDTATNRRGQISDIQRDTLYIWNPKKNSRYSVKIDEFLTHWKPWKDVAYANGEVVT